MSATLNTQIIGVNEAIRSLNKIEPGLRKQFAADITKISQPAINEAQRRYTALGVPLSGMSRNWQSRGRALFPFNPAKAVRGVKVKLDSDRRRVASILIQQNDAGTAVFESAGRANSNPLGNALGALAPGRTRVIGPAVYSKKNEISSGIEQATLAVVRRVQEELR